mmetsp:Transcript_1199/g.2880  ORF Transcript_1199/g.2880 Transcript_1199/m.2880 type:complete len:251 (+) Transcript_1199:133-885(+)
MPAFKPPNWAGQPCRVATLEVHCDNGITDKIPIDCKPYYLLGREPAQSDITLDSETCSRAHCALVHHQDGRLFLIDLGSTHGTQLDGKPVPANKPTNLKNGAVLRFGHLSTAFVVRVESSAEKRGASGQEEEPSKRTNIMHVRASHLLVKHRDSRRPSSWKEPTVTRTQEEALQMIQTFRERIVSGQVDFATLASTESHCSSAQRGGDLGKFGPGQMQKQFEDATYALQVGELSQPVFSDSGVHLILRTA